MEPTMSACCKAWCAGTIAAIAGVSAVGAWMLTRPDSEPAWTPGAETSEVRHATAPQLLAAAAERLHREALAHFNADPQNGFARMPFVYDKVVKEWKTPWFSTGELDREESVPFAKDMTRVHDGSLKDFLSLPVVPSNRRSNPVVHSNPEVQGNPLTQGLSLSQKEAKYDRGKKVWEPKSVDLIGLLKHDTPVVYLSEKAAHQKDAEAPVTPVTPVTRPLDEFEMAGLTALTSGENLFGRTREGVVRLLGAVRAEASCVACHRSKQEGDLLGAFSYTLREASYQRAPWPGRAAKTETPVQPSDTVQP
jgi:hypothetical protein